MSKNLSIQRKIPNSSFSYTLSLIIEQVRTTTLQLLFVNEVTLNNKQFEDYNWKKMLNWQKKLSYKILTKKCEKITIP